MELLSFGDAGWGDEMLRAAAMTLAVSLSSMALGLVFGTLAAAAKLSDIAPARWLAWGYTTVVRGVPELLIIYLLFFGGSGAVMFAAGLFGYHGYIELNAFTIGTFAIGAISGSYSTEVIRGAVLAVPRGQIEAAQAIGMSRFLLFRRIMLPQVARFALPGLGNVWQLTLKDTSLISVTGLVEIMRQAHVAAGSTRQPFTFYLVAACLYLLLTTFSNYGFRRAEAWAGRGVRRAA
jgi:octopine/nopaline transport system permease protein